MWLCVAVGFLDHVRDGRVTPGGCAGTVDGVSLWSCFVAVMVGESFLHVVWYAPLLCKCRQVWIEEVIGNGKNDLSDGGRWRCAKPLPADVRVFNW